jgi:dipeptidyl aminopeptidase/acylaminoacyl peptidase
MHGGPQRQVAKGYHPYLSYAVYDEMLERLVAGGHYVYKIDYTGSTGYGAEFRKALHMKIGDVEMNDVTRAVSALKKDVKVRNVHLIGNSYGGYMAFRGIVKAPKTFTGAVSINGVSDWYGLIDQIPSSPFKALFEGVPDTNNMQAYFQASVFTGMENLTKDNKVVVVWGERDSTVPVWQSTKYVEFAKTRKLSLDTLSFPEEDHIIRKRANLDALCAQVVTSLKVTGVTCKL